MGCNFNAGHHAAPVRAVSAQESAGLLTANVRHWLDEIANARVTHAQ